MKKIIIIGGGIAGISLALLLNRKKYRVQICERTSPSFDDGHSFLVHPSAYAVLQKMTPLNHSSSLPGTEVKEIFIKDMANRLIKNEDLGNWLCVRRSQLVQHLRSILPEDEIAYSHRFHRFGYDDKGMVKEVVFENGESLSADLVIGSDGARSLTREALFGPTAYSPVAVKEILGTVKLPHHVKEYQGKFQKFMHVNQGIAFGFIPCNETDLVWFMQFDSRLQKNDLSSPKKMYEHCDFYVKEFPEIIQEIVAANDFSKNYLWRSTDFDLLPCFHKKNVGLIGDAAHVALPFTSAGVANALIDGKLMGACLNFYDNNEDAFNKFYNLRHKAVEEHIKLGRSIQSNFLSGTYAGAILPLIKQVEKNHKNTKE